MKNLIYFLLINLSRCLSKMSVKNWKGNLKKLLLNYIEKKRIKTSEIYFAL